ncbi:MAG: hypothetical protein ACXAC2_13950 [Candidatus Kariarchaeaceae archaeon]|jgi:hypothetical protein
MPLLGIKIKSLVFNEKKFIDSVRATKDINYWILLVLINIMSGITFGITFYLSGGEYVHSNSKIPESLGPVGYLSFWPLLDVVSTEPLGFFFWGVILGISFTSIVTFVLIFIISLLNGFSRRLDSTTIIVSVISISSITILGVQLSTLIGLVFNAYFLSNLGILFIFWYYALIGYGYLIFSDLRKEIWIFILSVLLNIILILVLLPLLNSFSLNVIGLFFEMVIQE